MCEQGPWLCLESSTLVMKSKFERGSKSQIFDFWPADQGTWSSNALFCYGISQLGDKPHKSPQRNLWEWAFSSCKKCLVERSQWDALYYSPVGFYSTFHSLGSTKSCSNIFFSFPPLLASSVKRASHSQNVLYRDSPPPPQISREKSSVCVYKTLI